MSGLLLWLLLSVALTGLYMLLHLVADLLWPTRDGNTADGRPSCHCGERPPTGGDIVAFTDTWGRHTSQRCRPWEDQ